MSLSDLPLHPFARVESLAALCRLLSERSLRGEETVLLAGGTDFIVERHMAPAAPIEGTFPLVVDVSRIPELTGIAIHGDTARIGAGTTFLTLRRHDLLAARVPMLGAMSRDVGAIQIQARGTLGGNLATASPAADGVAALAALDAEIVLASERGTRSVPIHSYYTGYKLSTRTADEVICRIDFRLPKDGAFTSWRKVGTRSAQSISKVALAGVAEVAEGRVTRIGLGMASVAPTTALLPTVRALALDAPLAKLTETTLEAATLDDIAPIDDVRSTAAYRRHVAVALVKDFFRRLAAT